MQFLQEKLQRRKDFGNFRELKALRGLIDFSSNDYLGLARCPLLNDMTDREMAMHGNIHPLFGSTGSRLLTGNSYYIQELEDEIAAFHGYEAGLIFNCGYMANIGLLSAIMNDQDTVLFDAGVHASTHDGIRLSRARSFAFRHNDMDHLEKRLSNISTRGNRWICVESVYSMDGSKAQLDEICKLAKKYEAHVIVDEAHAVGVCGPKGRGFVAELNLTGEVFAQVVTFGKALGTHGAIVLGNHTLKQALINFANSYIYTTALPFHSLAAIKSTYALFPTFANEREHINNLVNIFRETRLKSSETHIQSFPVKGNEHARQLSKQLSMKGYDVRAILSPTVQRGNEILRISLHAFNHEDELKDLLKLLEQHKDL